MNATKLLLEAQEAGLNFQLAPNCYALEVFGPKEACRRYRRQLNERFEDIYELVRQRAVQGIEPSHESMLIGDVDHEEYFDGVLLED